MDRTIVVANRYSDTKVDSATNDQQGNSFKVHICSLDSTESHFMIAEVDLQEFSRLGPAVLVIKPALSSCHTICYYFDRNGDFVMMATQAQFDMFLNTRIDQHIYVLEVPPSLPEFTIKMRDSLTIFEFETDELDASWNRSTDSDLSTAMESDFDDFDAEEAYLEELDNEEFNLTAYGHTRKTGGLK